MKKSILFSFSILFFLCIIGIMSVHAQNDKNKKADGTIKTQDSLKLSTDSTGYKIDLKDWVNIFDMVKDKYPAFSSSKGMYIPVTGNAVFFELGRIRYTTKSFTTNPQVGDIIMIYDIIILDQSGQKKKVKNSISFTAI